MNTKLTLRLESQLIKRAKRYAAAHGISMSQMVSNYFSILENGTEATSVKGLPLTRSLCGVLKRSSTTNNQSNGLK